MFSDFLSIMLQSLELFSEENKKRIINALTIFQIILLYILVSYVYPPWFPGALAVIAFFGLLYLASKKQAKILHRINFLEFLINFLEKFEHGHTVDFLVEKEEIVKYLTDEILNLFHSEYINIKRFFCISILKSFQYYPFFFLVMILSKQYLSNIILRDLYALAVLYIAVSIALLLLRVNLHMLAWLSIEEYGVFVGVITFVLMVFILALLPLFGVEELFSSPEIHQNEYILRYRAHLSSSLDREAEIFFEILVSNSDLGIYHWGSHTRLDQMNLDDAQQFITQKLDTLMSRAEPTTVDVYNNIYVIGDTKLDGASIVIFTLLPKTRVSSYDKKGIPKRQIVEYHLFIKEIAVGRAIVADIISKIPKSLSSNKN